MLADVTRMLPLASALCMSSTGASVSVVTVVSKPLRPLDQIECRLAGCYRRAAATANVGRAVPAHGRIYRCSVAFDDDIGGRGGRPVPHLFHRAIRTDVVRELHVENRRTRRVEFGELADRTPADEVVAVRKFAERSLARRRDVRTADLHRFRDPQRCDVAGRRSSRAHATTGAPGNQDRLRCRTPRSSRRTVRVRRVGTGTSRCRRTKV